MQTQRRRARRLLLPRAFATRSGFTRRQAVAGAASLVAASAARPLRAQRPIYFGLTPVFLDSDSSCWPGWRTTSRPPGSR